MTIHLRATPSLTIPGVWQIYYLDGQYYRLLDDRTFPTASDAQIAINQYMGIGPY